MKPDFKKINGAALQRVDGVLERWAPGGKTRGREYVPRNPTRPDKKPGSFSINLDTGAWSDFATKDKGGDLISLVAYIDQVKQGDAAQRLAAFLGMADPSPATGSALAEIWRPIMPVPAEASAKPVAHPTHGAPSLQWSYCNEQGKVLWHIYRFEPKSPDEKKQFAPLTYCESSKGRRAWRWQGPPEPRVLYHLEELGARPGAIVMVCEGEKAADAAGKLFPECVVVSAMNGAQSPQKADWSSLAGRGIWLWPDHDEPGRRCMVRIAGLVRAAGAREIQRINPERFAPAGGALPEKWDAADALAEGWTAERCRALAGETGFLTAVTDPAAAPARSRDFELNDKGVWYLGDEKGGPIRIASPIRILARVRDRDESEWGLLLELQDYLGNRKRWCAPARLIKPDATELCSELRALGADVVPTGETQRRLVHYLSSFPVTETHRSVDRTGWHGQVFVLPDRTIGQAGEAVFYQTTAASANPYRARGSLEDWRGKLAARCVGNSRLTFCVSCAFGASLLHLIEMEGGGVHLRSDSSTGKTTVLRVAASVWGGPDYMQPLRATDNGLEGRAALHSHTLLVADEIGQADPSLIGQMIYMLGNGYGKGRMARGISMRKPLEWLVLVLTSGERGLVEVMAEVNQRALAGQEVRLLEIPADAGAGLGAFETLHGADCGAVFSRELTESAARHYGTAGPAFVEALSAQFAEVAQLARELQRKFVRSVVPENAHGQVERAALRFGVVAAAGELATRFGITGWPTGEGVRAAVACFQAWLEHRGSIGNQEDAAILAQVAEFFERHHEARFVDWQRVPTPENHGNRTLNAAGYRLYERSDEYLERFGALPEGEPGHVYFVYPEVFRREVLKGHALKSALRLLIDRHWLEPDEKTGQPSRKVHLPRLGTKAIYLLRGREIARGCE